MQNIGLDAIHLLQQSFSISVALANSNGQNMFPQLFNRMYQNSKFANPNFRIQQTSYSRMQTPPTANHEHSSTNTELERAMNIENECRTSPVQAAYCQRFYVDLSAQQDKVLLTKSKRIF